VINLRKWSALVGAFACVTALVGAGSANSAAAAPRSAVDADISIDPGHGLATVPRTAIGINGSTYDSKLLDSQVPRLLRDVGVKVIRVPGGSTSDVYDWKTNRDIVAGSPEAVDFDQFMSVVRATGAQAMVTVNYGSADTMGRVDGSDETGAQIAADWVRYANVTHDYHVKYWEIGNEIYGNGTYGANWETDDHCLTSPSGPPVTLGSEPQQTYGCGPATYATVAGRYIQAMKAVDPSIRVGAVLTAPGNWPDGVTNTQSPQSWNQTVLEAIGGDIGFADIHWYPQNPSNVTPPGPTDAGLLATTDAIGGMVSTLRKEFTDWANRADIPISVTETNSVSSNPGKQTLSVVNALFLNQDYLTWLTNGVSNVDWWQTHNVPVLSPDEGSGLFGDATYGDYGVLSNGGCATSADTTVCEPAADTRFSSYRGLQMLHGFIQPGDRIVAAASDQQLVRVYAVRKPTGQLQMMIINDDPDNAYDINLSAFGHRPSRYSSVAFYGPSSPSVQHLHGRRAWAAERTIPPYSITSFTLDR